MIGKITTGRNFGNLTRYLFKEGKKAKLIAANFLARTPKEINRKFNLWANSNSRTTKPVKHYAIGFAPQDGKLSNKLKAQIAEDIIRQMGFEAKSSYDDQMIIDNQYIVVAHGRKDPDHELAHQHDHIHIVINLINSEGKRIHDGWDKNRLQRVLRGLEKKYNLTPVKSSIVQKKQHSILEPISYNQPRHSPAEIAASTLGTIKDILAQELPKGHTFESLQANLDKRRIELTKNSRGYIYRIKRTDVEIVHFTNASKNPLNTRTELKLNQPESDRFFRVDHQKAKALNNAKQKIAKLVNEATKDNPDYFLFAQRLKQSNLIARLYRTKGRKRKGRYKLKYQIVKSIEFQSHSSLGGTLAKLIAEGKVKFDPEIHYQKEIPPEIVRQVQLEIEQAEKLKQNSNPTKQTIPTKIVESPPSSNIRPKTKKQKSDEMEL